MEVKISDYSGDVVGTDWTPALLAAFEDIRVTGGSIYIDDDIKQESQLQLNTADTDYTNLMIRGDTGSVNQVAVYPADHAIYLNTNILNTVIRDMHFIGNTITDQGNPLFYAALANVLFSGALNKTLLENVMFTGLASPARIVFLYQTLARVVNCKFGGCSAADVVHAYAVKGLLMKHTEFYDYENFRKVYYDKSQGRTNWIKVDNPLAENTANTGIVRIEDCRFDEGSSNAVSIDGYASILDGCRHNLNGGGAGYIFTNCKFVTIRNNWSGYPAQDVPWAVFLDCGEVIIENCNVGQGVARVQADANTRVKIINSPNVTLERV